MDNKLQPIDLIAHELSQKTVELAHYKVAIEELNSENQTLKKEIEELKKAKKEIRNDEA